MRYSIPVFVAGALAWAALACVPAPALAAESYDNCTGFIDSIPATITTQGTWCLRKDLGTGMSSGEAITVATNNVTIDCNDFKIGGLAAGVGTVTSGVYALDRYNLTVRNCNVRGFLYGIRVLSGGGHLIERNRLDTNTFAGIWAEANPGSIVRDNMIVDTGGSTSVTGEAYGIFASLGVDILDNTVNGVAPTSDGGNATAYGIQTSLNGYGSITGNRVRGLERMGTGTVFGIYNTNSGHIIVRGNDVQASLNSGSIGVRCFTNQGTAHDNVISGFETGVSNCTDSSNAINAN
jgi:hypothetical protein